MRQGEADAPAVGAEAPLRLCPGQVVDVKSYALSFSRPMAVLQQ